MIATQELKKITDYMRNRIARGKYTIGGVTKDLDIYKSSISDNTITIELYIANEDAGQITNIKLINIEGGIFADKPDSINKIPNKGVLIKFVFNISEV